MVLGRIRITVESARRLKGHRDLSAAQIIVGNNFCDEKAAFQYSCYYHIYIINVKVIVWLEYETTHVS